MSIEDLQKMLLDSRRDREERISLDKQEQRLNIRLNALLKKDFEDCKRIDDIDQAVVEAKWKRLGDHWGKLCVGLGEAGLY